jgi:inorganic pyrophosphatase/exopolyphosphatase
MEGGATEGGDGGEVATLVDMAVRTYDDITNKISEKIKAHTREPQVEGFLEDTFVSPTLKDCIFVGHLATDLDSVAGAIGAAELFQGVATKSEETLNGEIMYVLEEVAKIPEPPLFDDTPGASKPDENGKFRKICLVDHNDENQMVASIRNDPNRRKRIVGCIDHHALSTTFSSEVPLLLDLRPWGSMSSIVAHLYVRNNARMKKEVARLLMCAILSDTLNLQGPTTTDADRFAVALLAKWGGVEDPNEVARHMFRAKTTWITSLGPYQMVRGDQKDFKWDGWKVGISVLEVTDTEPVLAYGEELLMELRFLKKEKGGAAYRVDKSRDQGTDDVPHANELDFAFLFVVNIVEKCSFLLVCGGREYALASKAFPECEFTKASKEVSAPGQTISPEQTLCKVGPLVSRKAQFAPAFSKVLTAGFTCHKERVSSPAYKQGKLMDAVDDAMEQGLGDIIFDENQQFVRQSSFESFVRQMSAP